MVPVMTGRTDHTVLPHLSSDSISGSIWDATMEVQTPFAIMLKIAHGEGYDIVAEHDGDKIRELVTNKNWMQPHYEMCYDRAVVLNRFVSGEKHSAIRLEQLTEKHRIERGYSSTWTMGTFPVLQVSFDGTNDISRFVDCLSILKAYVPRESANGR